MTADTDPSSLLRCLLDGRRPAAQCTVVLSRDGLALPGTGGLGRDRAEAFAAVAGGLQPPSAGASAPPGTGSGLFHQSRGEFDGGVLVVVDVGEGTRLAHDDVDPGRRGRAMAARAERAGCHLSAPSQRSSTADGT
ncbi:roadblock/LC7 domain-containing protein [Saccharopolyspora sp. CA-218241]|uniref:roadblock/LC7 domain-containing protein n=1 Tax=Saccharopolyspora sp. CA-218241 TaxID=3240027 RepID=UPI003D952E32